MMVVTMTIITQYTTCIEPLLTCISCYIYNIHCTYNTCTIFSYQLLQKRSNQILKVRLKCFTLIRSGEANILPLIVHHLCFFLSSNHYPFHRLGSKESFFDTLPSDVQDGDIQYSKACLCPKIGEDIKPKCRSVSEEAFPSLFKKKMKPVTPTSPTNSCDRQKRDVHYSDNPTEEDMQSFRETPQLHSRLRREVELGSVPKENATRYCAERISETKIGKLCAKIGVNVQALVNTCSADVEVSTLFSNLN